LDEEIITRVDKDLMNNEPTYGFIYGGIDRGEDGWREEITRETMVAQVWHDYTSRH